MDLTAIRDVDEILAAIVRRARQLLHADMTYLSLNDEEEGASYMRVTDGALTAEFRDLRLPLGTGLLGLVAQAGAPYYTDDYQADDRFLHRDYIDTAVAGEKIRAILGVPLVVEGTVIGALLAVHRTVRQFPPEEISLLTSFAAHAAVALENARLFERTEAAMAEADEANRQIRAHSAAVEVAASAHDRLTDALVRGGGLADVAAVLADVLGVSLQVYDAEGRLLATVGATFAVPDDLDRAIADSRGSGRSVELATGRTERVYVAAALAGAEHLGTLVLHREGTALGLADRRTVERGALVTALVLLFNRSVAEAEGRVRGELLADLLAGRDSDPVRLVERARRQRAELEQPMVVAVAAVEGLERHRVAQVAARHADELRGLGGDHDGHVVVVVPGDDAHAVGTALRDRLVAAGGAATVGVVASAPGPRAIADSHLEALGCLTTLLTLGRTGEVSDPVRLGLARLVLGRLRAGRARRVRAVGDRARPRLRRAARNQPRGHHGGLVRRRVTSRGDGEGAAHPPQHSGAATGPGEQPAGRRMAGSGRRPGPADGPAAAPAETPLSSGGVRERGTRRHTTCVALCLLGTYRPCVEHT